MALTNIDERSKLARGMHPVGSMTLSLVGIAPWARSLFLDGIQLDGQGPVLRLLRSLQHPDAVAAPRVSQKATAREVLPRSRMTQHAATSANVN